MVFPVYNIFSSFFSALALFFISQRMKQYYRKTLFPLAKYFGNMSLAAGIGCFIDVFVFILFANNPFWLGVGSIIGGLWAIAAHVYGFGIFLHLVFPHSPVEKIITAGLVLVVLVGIAHIWFMPFSTVDERGVINFNFLPFTKIIFFLFTMAGLLPLCFTFVLETMRKSHLRWRSGFAAFAFLFLVLANSLQSSVGGQYPGLTFIVLPVIAYSLLFVAVILRVEADSP